MKISPAQKEQVIAHFLECLQPQEKLSTWQWADKHIFLPPSASPKAGNYDSSFTPFVRPVMDAWDDPKITRIVLMWAAQSSKTMTEIICLLSNTANDPKNQIFLMPSEPMAKSLSDTRYRPIVEHTPEVRQYKPADRHLWSKLEMQYTTHVINFIGGNSPAALASRSAGDLVLDEIDKLKKQLGEEADPISLLIERMKWFPNGTAMLSSTPTTEKGAIWIWYCKGTMEQYNVPCPHCRELFYPKWSDVIFPKTGDDGEELSFEKRGELAFIQCPNCGGEILERHKTKMLKLADEKNPGGARWIATNPNAPGNIRSFHYTEILSPISRLSSLVVKYLEAKKLAKLGNSSELQNFINSSLAEIWKEELGLQRKTEALDPLVGDFKEYQLPEGAKGIVAGVDTQGANFYYVIRAFGDYNESWLLTYGMADSFDDLEKIILDARFYKDSGESLPVEKIFIDSGGNRTSEVYDFARCNPGLVIPIKGFNSTKQHRFTMVPLDKDVVGGCNRMNIDTSFYKDTIDRRINLRTGYEGRYNLFAEVGEDYKKQMCSEYIKEGKWFCPKGRDNHLWDCEVYAWAGADYLNIENWQAPLKPGIQITENQEPAAEPIQIF